MLSSLITRGAFAGCLAAMLSAAAWGQTPPKMRSRYFTALTNPEINDYLKRNDVIFVPVGTIESMGAMPTDREYIIALAYTLKMAEEADGLVLPYVTYFYPGVTVTGAGSVYVPQDLGEAYLKSIAHSLLRQGFRHQVYIAAHGPADQSVAGMARDFFEETKDPIMYISASRLRAAAPGGGGRAAGGRGAAGRGAGRGAAGAGQAARVVDYGAYQVVGMLDEIPLSLDVPLPAPPNLPRTPENFQRLIGPLGATVGSYEPDPDHGNIRPVTDKITAEQRAQYGKEGAAVIEATVKAIDIKGVIQALKDYDKYVQTTVVPRFKNILPKDKLQ
jgi:creatinine amidohydrolase